MFEEGCEAEVVFGLQIQYGPTFLARSGRISDLDCHLDLPHTLRSMPSLRLHVEFKEHGEKGGGRGDFFARNDQHTEGFTRRG